MPQCTAGVHALCETPILRGISASSGLVSALNVDARACYPLRKGVPLGLAAMVEPIACAWQGVKKMGVHPGSKVLVIGTGPIGIAAIACLKARGVGAETIMVVGRNAARNEWARALGVRHLFATRDEPDVVVKAKQVFDNGVGSEIVFDAASTEETFSQGLASLRNGGAYCSYGIFHPDNITFNANAIWWKGLTMKGTKCYDDGRLRQGD